MFHVSWTCCIESQTKVLSERNSKYRFKSCCENRRCNCIPLGSKLVKCILGCSSCMESTCRVLVYLQSCIDWCKNILFNSSRLDRCFPSHGHLFFWAVFKERVFPDCAVFVAVCCGCCCCCCRCCSCSMLLFGVAAVVVAVAVVLLLLLSCCCCCFVLLFCCCCFIVVVVVVALVRCCCSLLLLLLLFFVVLLLLLL